MNLSVVFQGCEAESGSERDCPKAAPAGKIPSQVPQVFGSAGTNYSPSSHSSPICVRANPVLLCWADFYTHIMSMRLQWPLLWSLTQIDILYLCQTHRSLGCCRWYLMSIIPSISEVVLAEISKTNLIKHYRNCIFTGKGKSNQMKKDKTGRERKFISKHLRECYKQ